MAVPAVASYRSATEDDRSRLANLLHFETYVHRHLDWRRPLDWLGHEPYLVLETEGRLCAALAAPSDLPGIAWVRLFAAATRTSPKEAWGVLWPQVLERLRHQTIEHVAAIPLHDWFRHILTHSGFENHHNVVVLDWRAGSDNEIDAETPAYEIRPMIEEDLQGVWEADQAAFPVLWRNSSDAVRRAFRQAGSAAVIEVDQRIAAFQISTHGSRGLHLARLASHPDFQGRGHAFALVRDLQNQVHRRHEGLLTVNTQDNNEPSLALYRKLGFHPTGEEFPVYQVGPTLGGD
jgi:ribosomal protein S18 acetylase RimI-like enzyme